ncbi:ImmA/IrrE family metallo-endopeptidase [Lactococcus garvieae]|uniref:ImmA/IrrE family metallo-endopeptidase n=1 Tax=Lactococcus garvieae TaxID=1363 RepID=UPI0028900DA6|nr:ImmA/IrrE family metallo-endopeptidase [Lactococcus garvieae]MDT2741997.1 ImmA/IrrE family metallo-endopeptidase [Lactococcus garvieae]
MGKLRELSRELGAEIIYFNAIENGVELESDTKGVYLPDDNVIYIRDDLTIYEQENVILHELGHCYYGHVHYDCHSKGYNSKQEAEANSYMVAYRFKEWLLTWDFAPLPEELSVQRFMNAYHFEYKVEHLCEDMLEQYNAEYYETV